MGVMLVAGGAGFVGSAVARKAQEAGFEVHLTWRKRAPQLPVPAHQLDLTEIAAVSRLVESVAPDVVVNAASGPYPTVDTTSRVAGWRDSVMTTVCLLEACRDLPARFVHIASSHEIPPEPPTPPSRRGAIKLAALGAVRQWATETDNPTTVVRPFSIYGPGQPDHRLVPTLLRCALEGIPFPTPSRTTRRDLVYIDDVATGIVAAAHPDAPGGEFDLATGRDISVAELIDVVEEVTGRKVEIAAGKFRIPDWDRPRWAGDPEPARRVLGWSPTTDLPTGLEKTLAAMG